MSSERPFIVECRFSARPTVSFKKYLNATSSEDAMSKAAEAGSVPVRAWAADDPTQQAMEVSKQFSNLEKEVALLREEVAFLSRSDIIARPFSTIIWGALGGLIIFTILGAVLSLCMRSR